MRGLHLLFDFVFVFALLLYIIWLVACCWSDCLVYLLARFDYVVYGGLCFTAGVCLGGAVDEVSL